MNEPWRVSVLGELRLEQAETSISRFKYQKVGALLAYLAYHLRHVHAREVLIEIFWPDSSPEAGRANLSVAISSLRHQLEPPGTPAGTVVRADRYSVSLNPTALTTDVAQFETAIHAAAKADGTTRQVQELSRAVDLYAGQLLPGFYEEWISGEQQRLSDLFFDAALRLATHLEERGELSAALAATRKSVRADPLHEDANLRLMQLLVKTGQPGAALRQFKELERLMDQERGQEPGASLRALARSIEKEANVASPSANTPPAAVHSLLPTRSGPATLTFLLTDIEGSTRLFEQSAEAYQEAVGIHHETLRLEFARHQGQEHREGGDSFLVAFASAGNALACAIAAQKALSDQEWPEATGKLLVRMALHTGDVEVKEGEYTGIVLHRASRMLTAAHGGQILVSEATAGLLRRELPGEVRLSDLGLYRLRDVPSPERLYQVEYPGTAQFPPLAATAGVQGTLPLTFTRFFGREEEIATLEQQLRAPQTRLVTLTGPGGTGKTRLAIEAAGQLLEVLAGAVYFVSLADLSDPAYLLGALTDALHVPRSANVDLFEQILTALSAQPSLLVLDNFEQLLPHTELVERLLERVATLTILVTSRQTLGLPAEREFSVPPLSTPQGRESPAQLSTYDSVRLFVDRAQAAKPDFQVTNHNAPAVAELCDRLEGIPLAIELAAARIAVMTPSQMLALLGNRFELLVSRKRGVVARQKTLRATLDWSYRLLDPALQQFFAALSVFRGGWSVEAAEAVCAEPLALDYLAQLQDASLVEATEKETTNQQEQRVPIVRFHLLETLREYAWDQLEPERRQALQNQHTCYLLQCLRLAPWAVMGSFDYEQSNFRAALEWELSVEGSVEQAARLTSHLAVVC